MSPSGRKTASAVMPMTLVRANPVRMGRRGSRSLLARLHRRLPLLDEVEALGLVEVAEQVGADRNRLGVGQDLGVSGDRHLAFDVAADRAELGLVGDDALATLGEDVVDPELGRVRV